jgi:hypothetical protein
MTLGPKEEHAMTAKLKQQAEPFDAARFRKELGLKIQRLVAESIAGWPTCENTRCRRAKRCASQDYECIAKWRESLPPISPEEAKARMEDFRIALDARRRLGRSVTKEQLTEAIRKEKEARRAATPQAANTPAPVAEETQLAPEKVERINRAWNDYVASLPAEEDRAREAGPRIRML